MKRRFETDLVIFGLLAAIAGGMLIAFTLDSDPPPSLKSPAEKRWIDQLTSSDPRDVLQAQRHVCRWDPALLNRWKLDLIVLSQALRLDAIDALAANPGPLDRVTWTEIERNATELMESLCRK